MSPNCSKVQYDGFWVIFGAPECHPEKNIFLHHFPVRKMCFLRFGVILGALRISCFEADLGFLDFGVFGFSKIHLSKILVGKLKMMHPLNFCVESIYDARFFRIIFYLGEKNRVEKSTFIFDFINSEKFTYIHNSRKI
jgi:hypothetical protein